MNCSEIYLEKRNNAKPAYSPPKKKQMTKQQNIQDPKMKKMNYQKRRWYEKMRKEKIENGEYT